MCVPMVRLCFKGKKHKNSEITTSDWDGSFKLLSWNVAETKMSRCGEGTQPGMLVPASLRHIPTASTRYLRSAR